MNNIPELQKIRKSIDFVYPVILILLATLSFGLGRLSATRQQAVPVSLCPEIFTQNTLTTQAISATPLQNTTQDGNYVASKNGSVYHLPWCSGAQRILEENKVWFATKEEAEAAGYRPAGNCKGL